MSHIIAAKSVPIKDKEAVRKAVEELGGTLVEKKTYNWFGRSVGDYPLPEGVSVSDLGKCEYAAKFPGINYEVGFSKIKGNEDLFPMYDFYGYDGNSTHDGHKLKQKVGNGCAKLLQAYTKHATINAATLAGYMVLSNKLDKKGNVVLELAVM